MPPVSEERAFTVQVETLLADHKVRNARDAPLL
jgi:hypothetical protein